MGRVEIRFAAGMAAFKRGEPRDACPYTDSVFDWTCGWDSALERKRVTFRDYIKLRDLLEREFTPTGDRRRLDVYQDMRRRRIVTMEEEYPDFRAAFADYQGAAGRR